MDLKKQIAIRLRAIRKARGLRVCPRIEIQADWRAV